MGLQERFARLPDHAYPRLLLILGFGLAVTVLGALVVALSGPGTPGGTVGTVVGVYGFGVFAVTGLWYTTRFVLDHLGGGS